MGLVDAIGRENRVELTVSDLQSIMRTEALSWAQNQVMINGLKAHISHDDILTMVGENDTEESEDK